MSYLANVPWTPNIFTDSGPPIKWLLGGLITGAPDPSNPPYGGGAEIFFGGLLLMVDYGHNWPKSQKQKVSGTTWFSYKKWTKNSK